MDNESTPQFFWEIKRRKQCYLGFVSEAVWWKYDNVH